MAYRTLFEVLAKEMPREFLEDALVRGIQDIRRAGSETRERFSVVLKFYGEVGRLNLRGYRNLADAPIPRLLADLRPLLQNSGPLAEVALQSWLDGRPEFRHAAEEYALKSGGALCSCGGIHSITPELRRVADELAVKRKLDRNGLLIALATLEPSSKKELPALFKEWIAALGKLGPHAPEWEALEALHHAALLERERMRNGELLKRDELSERIKAAGANWAAELDVLELALGSLQKESDLASAEASVGALEALLAEVRSEVAKPAVRLSERAAQAERLRTLGERARSLTLGFLGTGPAAPAPARALNAASLLAKPFPEPHGLAPASAVQEPAPKPLPPQESQGPSSATAVAAPAPKPLLPPTEPSPDLRAPAAAVPASAPKPLLPPTEPSPDLRAPAAAVPAPAPKPLPPPAESSPEPRAPTLVATVPAPASEPLPPSAEPSPEPRAQALVAAVPAPASEPLPPSAEPSPEPRAQALVATLPAPAPKPLPSPAEPSPEPRAPALVAALPALAPNLPPTPAEPSPEPRAQALVAALPALAPNLPPTPAEPSPEPRAQALVAALPALAPNLPPTPAEPSPEFAMDATVAHRERPLVAVPVTEYVDSRLSVAIGSLTLAGDLPWAYWLSRAEEGAGRRAPIPSYLLKALVGALHITGDASPYVAGLLDVTSAWEFPAEPVVQPFAAAAALAGALRAPASNLGSWLRVPEGMAFLRPILDAVRTFLTANVAIPPNLLRFLESTAERHVRVTAAAQDITRFLQDAPKKRTRYVPANSVWLELLRGHLGGLLAKAASNDASDTKGVREGLKQYTERTRVENLISDVGRRIGPRDFNLEGAARKWLIERIEEAVSYLRTWLDVIDAEAEFGTGDRLSRRLSELQEAIRKTMPDAEEGLASFEKEHPTQMVAAEIVRRALASLSNIVGLRQPELMPWQIWEPLYEGAPTLDAFLERSLARLPSVRLPPSRAEWDTALADIATAISAAMTSPPSVEQVVEAWIAARDFRFIEALRQCVPDASVREVLDERRQVALAEARQQLSDRLQNLRTELERAVVDGVIEDERAAVGGTIEAIHPEGELNVAGALARLESAAKELEDARARSVGVQRRRWQNLRPRLPELGWTPFQQQKVIERTDELLARGDYRSADELLAELAKALDQRSPFDETLFTSAPRTTHLEQFLGILPRLEEALVKIRGREAAKRAQEILAASSLPGTRREVKATHELWVSLTNIAGVPDLCAKQVIALLAELGYSLHDDTPERVEVRGRGCVEVTVRARAPRESPVPHFGSRVDGRLKVLCVWHLDAADPLGTALQHCKTEGEGALILYLDRLSLIARRQKAHLQRKLGATALILDEWLLLYLASLHNDRLAALFDCGLAFTQINPYVGRGPVAREMFFGRDDMARQLREFGGTCLVYGGRQLGKSALLEHVRRTFTEDDQRHTAVLLEIQSLGDPQASDPEPKRLWGRLRDALKEKKFLGPNITTDKPAELLHHIKNELGRIPGRRLLILLDEADKFLDADAQQSFEQVRNLRTLMTENPGSCKVVLAGLHNVQRFQGIANQPLAHFGPALLVGPLDPAAADALVRTPLEALGFRFAPEEKNGAVLRILSYTNYHPGLIQLFCRGLVELLLKRSQPSSEPPYYVRESDVEEVYRKAETRRDIKDRFEWTLDLDTRYQAIVWNLIIEQHGDEDGYSAAFLPNELLALVRRFWPQGFEGMEAEEMRGLLDEMHGLGVLVRTAEGRYRLRSPNIVRLLGHVDELWDRLQELERKPPRPTFDADHHRMRLQAPRGVVRYSPLTFQQERLLLERRTQIVFVTGCSATDLGEVPSTLRKALDRDEGPQDTRFIELNPEVASDEALRALIEAERPTRRGNAVLVLHRSLRRADLAPGRFLESAARVIAAQHTQLKIKLLLSTPPEVAWNILVSGDAARGSFLYLRRWSRHALDALFNHAEIRSADENLRRRILETTTGGWSALVHQFAERVAEGGDARAAVEAMERDLAPGQPAAKKFLDGLELWSLPRIRDVLELLADGEHPSTTSFDGVLDGDLGALAGHGPSLLELLHGLGVLDGLPTRLRLEPRVRASLPR